jgi:hypothetical protein
MMLPNDQELSHAARDFRQPETRSDHHSRSEQLVWGIHLVAALGTPN